MDLRFVSCAWIGMMMVGCGKLGYDSHLASSDDTGNTPQQINDAGMISQTNNGVGDASLGPPTSLGDAMLPPDTTENPTWLYGNGNGLWGAGDVTASGTVINKYASVSADVAAGASTVSVGAFTGSSISYSVQANLLVMLWQTTGASGVTVGDQTDMDLATLSVGHYEFRRLVGVTGSSITVDKPLTYAYGAGTSQVVIVPEYTSLTISDGASLTAMTWNGSKGGVVVVFVTGAITIADGAAIRVDGQGFGGGAYANAPGVIQGCGNGPSSLSGTPDTGFGLRGEGFVVAEFGVTQGGRGNVSHGAGGGGCGDSGGGGGGHGGQGGAGAFNTVSGVYNGYGGLGGTRLLYNPLDRVAMGGGGGAGQGSNARSTAGGRGGGVIILRGNSLTAIDAISARGESAANSTGQGDDGAGGGGAGGAMVLRVINNLTCSPGNFSVAGGSGGSSSYPSSSPAVIQYPGGGGSGGRILIQSASHNCNESFSAGSPGFITGNGSPATTNATPDQVTGSTYTSDPVYLNW